MGCWGGQPGAPCSGLPRQAWAAQGRDRGEEAPTHVVSWRQPLDVVESHVDPHHAQDELVLEGSTGREAGGSRDVTCHRQHGDGETGGWTSSPSGDMWVRTGHCRGIGCDVSALLQPSMGHCTPPGTCSCRPSPLNLES